MIEQSLLTVTEAAASLGVSARTVERMLRDGRLPSLRIGAARMIGAIDVEVLRSDRCPKRQARRART
jgi:excisionase family DNA binding protein